MIPLCDVQRQYEQLKPEIDSAVQESMATGRYILGPNVKAFEQEMADYLGCEYAVGVNSGTDALHLALRALHIGPGDEVITTPFTFVATTEAIGMVGATPVFVDIDPQTFNLDPQQIEAAITPRTKAILPVHLYGQPCDMAAIIDISHRHALLVVEDNAQSLGAAYDGKKVGTIGDVGCLSFFPSKNLGCFGDGGMLVTNNRDLYERAEMLRRHGGKVKYHHTELGLNSRLDDIQAAILRVKLPHLDSWNASRRQAAYYYNQLLSNVSTNVAANDTTNDAANDANIATPVELQTSGPISPCGEGSNRNAMLTGVYHQYTLQVENRSALQSALQSAEIGSAIYYPLPLHRQELHADLGYKRGDFPAAEAAADRCLSLPMFPGITQQQQQAVIDVVLQHASRTSSRMCA